MEKKILGRAKFRCKLCGKPIELTIQSSKEEYKHDYSTLTNLAHKCSYGNSLNPDREWLGKLELLGIYFDNKTVTIDADDDAVVAFNQPPLKIDWGDNNE